MKQFNPKNWSIRDEIIKRVNLEAEIEHANDPVPPLPKYVEPVTVGDKPGIYVFAVGILNQLRP